MQKAIYIGFDLETGGFSYDKNPITQIAMIALDGNTLKEIDRMEFYVKPYDDLRIEKQALLTTGLKLKDIRKGYDKKTAVNLIRDFAKKNSKTQSVRNRPILFAHNSKFDIGFLKSLFSRCNDDWKKVFNPVAICTQQWSKAFSGKNESLKLGSCCERVGIELKDAHKAMNDTLAMVKLFRFYVLNMRNINQNSKEEIKTKKRVTFQF